MPKPFTIADAWRDILNGAPGARRGDPLLLRAAAEHPVLGLLYPFPTHGTLCFFRTIPTILPVDHEDELPFIVCETSGYKIYAPDYRPIARASTPGEAVALFADVLADFPAKPPH